MVGPELEAQLSDNKTLYSLVKRDGLDYKVGDCVFILPEAFHFDVKRASVPKKTYRNDAQVLILSQLGRVLYHAGKSVFSLVIISFVNKHDKGEI